MEQTRSFVHTLFLGNTRNNYLHEMQKGRSVVTENPVSIEPVFEPFDATRPYSQTNTSNISVDSKQASQWHFCQLRLPRLDRIEWNQAEKHIRNLSTINDLCSFEVVYANNSLSFYLGSTSKNSLGTFAHSFEKNYSEAVIYPCNDPNREFETKHYFTFACYSYHQKVIFSDSIYEQVNKPCRIQTIFRPVKNNWHNNIKEMQKAEKLTDTKTFGKDLSKPLYAVSVRIGCLDKQTLNATTSLFGTIIQNGKPLRKINARTYQEIAGEAPKKMFQERTAFASGMLLTSDELSGFIHMPVNVNSDFVKGYPVPEELKKGCPLGINSYCQPTIVCMPEHEEYKSGWLLGRSRSGKSTSLLHQASYLAKRGAGILFLDPHRKSAQELIHILPEELVEQVIFLDYEDKTHIINYNPFEEKDPTLYGAQTLQTVNSLESLFDSESFHRMNHLLRMSVRSLFELKRNITSIPILFSESAEGTMLRKQVIAQTSNTELKRFWRNEYPTYSREAFSPIQNRLSGLFMDEKILKMFSQTKNSIEIEHFWETSKIVICALPTITELADTIGSLLLGQCQKIALSRNRNGVKFKEFYVFADEFYRFQCTEIIESIINETAKVGLHLYVANQTTKQLSKGLLESVSSMKNIMLFGMNTFDAKKMKEVFDNEVNTQELVSLPVGGCIAKISGQTIDFQGFKPLKRNPKVAQKIIEYSRKHYYTPISTLKEKKKIVRELDHFE